MKLLTKTKPLRRLFNTPPSSLRTVLIRRLRATRAVQAPAVPAVVATQRVARVQRAQSLRPTLLQGNRARPREKNSLLTAALSRSTSSSDIPDDDIDKIMRRHELSPQRSRSNSSSDGAASPVGGNSRSRSRGSRSRSGSEDSGEDGEVLMLSLTRAPRFLCYELRFILSVV